jgi:hypothetical protein
MRTRTALATLAFICVPFAIACGGDEEPSGPAGVGGASTSSGAGATSSSSASANGGATTSSSSGSSTGGGSNDCTSASFTLCEDFEGAADGAFPTEWGARGDEWGVGVIGVASDDSRSGSKSLKVDGGNNGQHFMDYKGSLGSLASHHYGRVYLKVAVPAPWPSSGVLHADFIEGLGPGPNNSNHNVRWGVVENTQMMYQWIYNVQPSSGDPEFAEGTSYVYDWTGAWQCIEWFYDEPSQQGTLWIDGVEIPIVPGTNHAAEIPVFTSLGVGLANYQDAGEGFTVWFDDLAYDDDTRIGCAN